MKHKTGVRLVPTKHLPEPQIVKNQRIPYQFNGIVLPEKTV